MIEMFVIVTPYPTATIVAMFKNEIEVTREFLGSLPGRQQSFNSAKGMVGTLRLLRTDQFLPLKKRYLRITFLALPKRCAYVITCRYRIYVAINHTTGITSSRTHNELSATFTTVHGGIIDAVKPIPITYRTV